MELTDVKATQRKINGYYFVRHITFKVDGKRVGRVMFADDEVMLELGPILRKKEEIERKIRDLRSVLLQP